MKKICLFLFLLIPLFFVNFQVVNAEKVAEEDIIETVVEKVYTYEDESAVVTLTLRTDMTYKIVAVEPDTLQEMLLNGNYKVNEDGNIELYMGETYFDEICLNELTMTFDFVEEEAIIYPCSVKVVDSAYGEVLYDVYEGNIGDVVTLVAKPYVFCKVLEVKVNDVVLTPNKNGEYQFILVEGENIVTSSFAISEADMAILAENVNNYKKGNLEDIFTFENITNLISWTISGGSVIGLIIAILKAKKIKAQTGNEISVAVNENIVESVKELVKNTFNPIFLTLNKSISNIEKCVTSLNRCMILAQENTPESRLAILDELTIIKKETKELKEEAKTIIEKQIHIDEDQKQEKIKALEELEKNNEELGKKIKGRI